MAYTAQFISLRGNAYQISIGGTGNGELQLSGDNPVTIEYKQDDVFKPLKMSSCSVTVLTSAPLLSLYTGTLNGVTCTVDKGSVSEDGTFSKSSTIWFGFLTPNVYSSGYKDVLDEMTLEFVDPLSAMENVKFKYFGDGFFATFKEYITQALSAVGASGVSINMAEDSIGCIQRNFIDESDDDKDGAMTWKEVLENILLYMNKTACIWGNELKVFDGISPSESNGSLSVAESNGSLSMGEIYNKVTVVANNNPLDSSIPDPLTDDDFINNMANFGAYQTTRYSDGQDRQGERCPQRKNPSEYYLYNAAYKSKKWQLSESIAIKTYEVSNAGGINNVSLELSATSSTATSSTVTFDLSTSSQLSTDSNYKAWIQNKHYDGASFIQRYASRPVDGITSSLSWNKCLTLGGKGAKASIKSASQPMFVGQGGYLIISCKFKQSYFAYAQDCMQSFQRTITTEGEGSDEQLELKCSLNIGKKYWNGTAWQNGAATFMVKHTPTDDKYSTGTAVSIDNEVSFDLHLSTKEEGKLIPLPSGVLNGKIGFGIENVSEDATHINASYYHITELKVMYVTADTVEDIFNLQDYEADITYTNVIDEANVKEADDIEMRVNTYTAKATSYSYAMKKESASTYSFVIPDAKPEETCIQRLVSFYSQPRVRYTNTFIDNGITPYGTAGAQDFTGSFVVGDITYNLSEGSADVTLIQT